MKNLYAAWIYTHNQDQDYLNDIMEFARCRYIAVLGISTQDIDNLMHTLSAYNLNILIATKQIYLSNEIIKFCSRKGISIIRY